MLKPTTNYLLAALLFAATPAHSQTTAPTPSQSTAQLDAMNLIEQGRQALAADKYVEASQALEAALRMRAFADLSPSVQFRAYLFASLSASGRDDYLGAHEFMMAATEYEEATPQHWMLRGWYGSWVDAWPDATFAVTTLATRWPAVLLKEGEQEFIGSVGMHARRDTARRGEYLALLNALFDARYTGEFGIQPDGFWKDLALDALERKDMKRAREIATRFENSDTLLRMRIDRRFDALVAADPKRFDIAAAVKRQSKSLAKVVAANPRALDAFVQYAYALMNEGRYAEVLEKSNVILARVSTAPEKSPPYDDIADSLNWVYNHKAAALRALGRWDEALAVMEVGRQKLEKGSVNVSQAINLGFHFNDAGQPQKALDALKDIDWSRGLSPYGRMQLQHVRYRAYLQLGNKTEADNVLAYLREHAADADDTWLLAMLDSGDLDSAAALLISQLHDPENRSTALFDAQDYLPRPVLPRMKEAHDRWLSLLARADVTAAINEVGRREKVPIYRTPD